MILSRFRVVTVVALLALSGGAIAQEHNHPPVVVGATVTAKDTIPDFAANPTLWSVQSGPCQDPATWQDKRQPTATDVVLVVEGHIVRGSCNAKALGVRGTYSLDAGVYTVGDTIVYREGVWSGAHTGQIVIRDQPLDFTLDPKQFGSGFIVFGELNLQGTPKTAFLRTVEPIAVGATEVVLERAPDGWRPGDRVVVPDTRQVPIGYKPSTSPEVLVPMQFEERVIASIDGHIVTVTQPFTYDHLPAHLANLTRSIVVRSQNPNGTRGHFMVTERAAVKIKHVAFKDLGRTTTNPLDPSFNPIGRYDCIHAHHLEGPRNLANVGYQFILQGNVCEGSGTPIRPKGGGKWGMAIHNSHWGLVTDNVFYKFDGAALVAEQGNERGNEIRRNIAIAIGQPISSWWNPTYGGVRTQPGQWIDFGWEGSAYWLAGNDHIFTDNVAANTKFSGIMFNARAATGFANHHPKVPKFRGASNAIDAEWDFYGFPTTPVKPAPGVIEVRGNEVYASAVCLWVAFAGGFGTMYDTTCKNIRQSGAYVARNGWAHFENLSMVNDPAASALNYEVNRGIDSQARPYTSGGLGFKNVTVTGWNIGVYLPGNTMLQAASLWPDVSPEIVIDGLTAKNNINIVDSSPHVDKSTVIRLAAPLERNSWGKTRPVSIPPTIIPATPLDIMEAFEGATVDANIIKRSTLVVHPSTGAPYEYFFPQQDPARIMAERIYPAGVRPPLQNCPAVGLTNAQCMAQYGVSTLGKPATCTTTSPTVRGFVCPLK